MLNEEFNIGAIEFDSRIYGPGKRTVIWFQGCTLGCKGCWNKQFQSNAPNQIIDRTDLLEIILSKSSPVTFLGGEPLQQLDNLTWLIDSLSKLAIPMLLYTGYELEEINADPKMRNVCSKVDILIPGRYREQMRNTNLTWRGSENQPVLYRDSDNQHIDMNQVEITIDECGAVTCLGYPSEQLREYIELLDQHGSGKGLD